MSFTSSLIFTILGFVLALWLVFTIIHRVQLRKYEKKKEKFLKRVMSDKQYLRWQEIDNASLWRILWNKV